MILVKLNKDVTIIIILVFIITILIINIINTEKGSGLYKVEHDRCF